MNIINNLCDLCGSTETNEIYRDVILHQEPIRLQLDLCDKCLNIINQTSIPNNITREQFKDIIFTIANNINFSIYRNKHL